MTDEATAARRIIRTLRSGAADPFSAKATTVGTAALESKLRATLQSFSVGNFSPSALMVEGDWGSGKSHTAMLCRRYIEELSLPWVHASVDGRGGSLSHLHRSVPTWIEGLRIGPVRGLQQVLEHGLVPRQAAVDWAKASTSPFGQALTLALNGSAKGWLEAMGHQFAMPDYSYQHPKALQLFLDLGTFLGATRAQGGVVVLLDEVENVAREHNIVGRKQAYQTLGTLIRDGGLFLVLFVTPFFIQQCKDDLERGKFSRWFKWGSSGKWFIESLLEIPRLRVPVLDERLAAQLVHKLVDEHRRAYGAQPGTPRTEQLVEAWKSTATRSTRLLVRMTIQHLDLELLGRLGPPPLPAKHPREPGSFVVQTPTLEA